MKFSEIIGHSDVKARLIKSANEGRVSHAQLFLSPQGAGGLPMAIAYAQYISCENKQENDSCGVCKSCIKYEKLVHPDLHFVFPIYKTTGKEFCDNYIDLWRKFVLENPYFNINQWMEYIDAENSQGSIYTAEGNEIIRKLNFKTFEAEYKIMIIWLPEKMNTEASNKILKILEEPYEKTLFLLVSEDSGKIIQTILSRTQLVKISKIDAKSIEKQLVEKHQISTEQAKHISLISEGNYLQAINFIKSSDDQQLNFDLFVRLMRFSYGNNVLEIMKWVDEITNKEFGREKQKNFFVYALRLVQNNLIMNKKIERHIALDAKETEFSSKFNTFINQRNVSDIYEEFSKASFHIERNGYAKLIFLDLAFKLMILLKK
jgi:DNA polymerase-3 subunit delta'